MNKIHFSERLNDTFLKTIKLNLEQQFKNCKKIAIKIHFGESGNKNSLFPEQVKPIINVLKELNLEYFLLDTSAAYPSPRNKPESHKKAAIEKGWDKLGKIITEDKFKTFSGKYYPIEVSKYLVEADGVLIITHFKGHVCSGFGGAIKNLGMGASTYELITIN